MICFDEGSEASVLTESDMKTGLYAALDKLGERERVLMDMADRQALEG